MESYRTILKFKLSLVVFELVIVFEFVTTVNNNTFD